MLTTVIDYDTLFGGVLNHRNFLNPVNFRL